MVRINNAARTHRRVNSYQSIVISTLAHVSLLLALACWTIAQDPGPDRTLSVAWSDRGEAAEFESVKIEAVELPPVESPPQETTVATRPLDSATEIPVPRPAVEADAATNTDWYADLHAAPTATRLAPPSGGATSLTSARGTGDRGESSGEGHPIRFFGAEAYGEKVVFVLDRSSSMRGMKFAMLKQEFSKSIERLDEATLFNVIFFGYWIYERDRQGLRPATEENKEKMLRWVRAMGANESTVVAPAIERALQCEPDVIFFLTDGEFSPWVIGNITQKNADRIPIHTIGLKNQAGSRVLTELARRNEGHFTFVP